VEITSRKAGHAIDRPQGRNVRPAMICSMSGNEESRQGESRRITLRLLGCGLQLRNVEASGNYRCLILAKIVT
jgi:hypothetical protein